MLVKCQGECFKQIRLYREVSVDPNTHVSMHELQLLTAKSDVVHVQCHKTSMSG